MRDIQDLKYKKAHGINSVIRALYENNITAAKDLMCCIAMHTPGGLNYMFDIFKILIHKEWMSSLRHFLDVIAFCKPKHLDSVLDKGILYARTNSRNKSLAFLEREKKRRCKVSFIQRMRKKILPYIKAI